MGNECIKSSHQNSFNAQEVQKTNREQINILYKSLECQEEKMRKQVGRNNFCSVVSEKAENVEVKNQDQEEKEEHKQSFESKSKDKRNYKKNKIKFSAIRGNSNDGDLRSTQKITMDELENQSIQSSSVSDVAPLYQAGLSVVFEVESRIQKSQGLYSSLLRTPFSGGKQSLYSSPFLSETLRTDGSNMNFGTVFDYDHPFIAPNVAIAEQESQEIPYEKKIFLNKENESLSWSIKSLYEAKPQNNME